MTKKSEVSPTLPELAATGQHIRDIFIDNAKTDTLVYGLLLSLHDDYERGAKPKTIKKEFSEAIALAHEQFSFLFFTEKNPAVDEQPKKEDE